MKIFNVLFLVVTIITCSLNSGIAQTTKLSEELKKETIDRLVELLDQHYVFPDVAKKTGNHIKQLSEAGKFKTFKDAESFATALTKEVQSVNKDKHMRIRPAPPYEAPERTNERLIEERLSWINQGRQFNGGVVEVKKLEGNIGYLDLRGFAGMDVGAPLADSYMKILSTADAIIIDLRKNGGGSPAMVQYLCSYFFDKKIHLNSLYWRRGDQTEEFWTLEKVNGKKLPEIPLFVMTSDYTFSGAEEFAYNMQTRKRATLVGQTTGGGANPGGTFPINDAFVVFIPTGKAINPVTKTNWEGVGVVPEIKTSPEETMDKTHELAKKAGEAYRKKTEQKNRKLLTQMFESIEATNDKNAQSAMIKSFKQCISADLISEQEINQMGYEQMMQEDKPKVAEMIFEANTKLFPDSPNVYDSYAEALARNGNKEAALKNYQKAVQLAADQQDPNLPLFKENLMRLKSERP